MNMKLASIILLVLLIPGVFSLCLESLGVCVDNIDSPLLNAMIVSTVGTGSPSAIAPVQLPTTSLTLPGAVKVVSPYGNQTNQSAYCTNNNWKPGLVCINNCPSTYTCTSNCTCIPSKPPTNQTNQTYNCSSYPAGYCSYGTCPTDYVCQASGSYCSCQKLTNQTNQSAYCTNNNWKPGLACINNCPSTYTCTSNCTCIPSKPPTNQTNQSAYCTNNNWKPGLVCINNCPSTSTCTSNCTCSLQKLPANQTKATYCYQSVSTQPWQPGIVCVDNCPIGTLCTSNCTCIPLRLPINQTNETYSCNRTAYPYCSSGNCPSGQSCVANGNISCRCQNVSNVSLQVCTTGAIQCSGRTKQVCNNGKWLDDSFCAFGCSGGQCLSQVVISNLYSMLVGVPMSVTVSTTGFTPAYYVGSLGGSPAMTKSGKTAVFTITCQQAGVATLSVSAYSSDGKLIGTATGEANCMKR